MSFRKLLPILTLLQYIMILNSVKKFSQFLYKAHKIYYLTLYLYKI